MWNDLLFCEQKIESEITAGTAALRYFPSTMGQKEMVYRKITNDFQKNPFNLAKMRFERLNI